MQYGREIACDLLGLAVPQWFLTCRTGRTREDVLKVLRLDGILDILFGDSGTTLTPMIDSYMADYRNDDQPQLWEAELETDLVISHIPTCADRWTVWTPTYSSTDKDDEFNGHAIAWCLRFGAIIVKDTPTGNGRRRSFFLPDGERNMPTDAATIISILKVLFDALELDQRVPESLLLLEKLQLHLDNVARSEHMGNHLHVRVFPPAYVPLRPSLGSAAVHYGCPNPSAWRLSFEMLNSLYSSTCGLSSSGTPP